MKAYRSLLGCLLAAFFFALPTSASAQCSGIFSAGEVCGNSTASGTLAARASMSSMFDRAFCGTNNSTTIRLAGTWVCLGLGTGVPTFLTTPSSANLAAAITDETGSGALVFATSPTLVTPALGTPSAIVLTNGTGLPLSTGVTGNLTVSHLNSGTSASSSTFWRGDGTWATPAGAGNVSTSGTPANGQMAQWTSSTTVQGISFTITPQHRITLASATPVMTSSQAAKTTVYVTPYSGNLMPIYDGTNFIPTVFAETSQATTDTTKSPAAVAASSVYDIFCWVDSGTNRCTRGPAWTNINTRSAGTALVMVNGILLNSVSITNGPAASRGTYMGSICSDGSSQINYVFGTTGTSGGTAANLCVWNAYNRRNITTTVQDTGTSYSYTGAGTIRQVRGGTNFQATVLLGLLEDGVGYSFSSQMSFGASNGLKGFFGIGVDSTSAFTKPPFYCRQNQTTNAYECGGSSSGSLTTAQIGSIGVHVISGNEESATGAVTMNLGGDATPTQGQTLDISLFN